MNNSKSSIIGSDVNLRKDAPDTLVTASLNNNNAKKRKNIREIYLKSVNQNRSKKGGLIRNKNITNLDESALSKGSSSYLANEYNLVKKILNATKALERLKTNNVEQSNKSDFMTRSSAPKYKTQEEYYGEILELKRSLKMLENNEMITKAKMEYYENELAKKEQEILNLLDVKKSDELRSPDSKSDLETTNLKLKAYKLEFSLKRKDAELKKLKDDLKTANIKELKTQNERLRVELSKALMNDRKIIEAQEIRGFTLVGGKPFYELLTQQVAENPKIEKNEIIKQNIAKRLQKSENYDELDDAEFVSNASDIKEKIVLKGTLKEKLEQLDNRETELLKEISRLNNVIQTLNEKRSARSSYRSQSAGSFRSSSSHTSLNEKVQLNAIKTLQSVMKGHLERTKSLNANDSENELRSDKLSSRKSSKAVLKTRTPSPVPITPPFSPEPVDHHFDRKKNLTNRHRDSDKDYNNRRKLSPPDSAREQRTRYTSSPSRQNSKNISRKVISSSDDDDDKDKNNNESNDPKKKLIENQKIVEQADTHSCCSPWRREVNARPKKIF